MTRTKALIAGTAIAAVTALSAAAVTAAPGGKGPASADAPRGHAHQGIHKAKGDGKGWGKRHGHGRGDHCKRGGRHMEKRVELIEGLMTFTPVQETAWKDLKTSMETGRETMEKACEARKEEGRPKTALERFDRFEKGMTTRLSVMQSVKPAFEKFYGTLTEKQQKAVDRLFTRKGRRG